MTSSEVQKDRVNQSPSTTLRAWLISVEKLVSVSVARESVSEEIGKAVFEIG